MYSFIYRGNAVNTPVIVTLAILVVVLFSLILMGVFIIKRKFGWPSTGTYYLVSKVWIGF